MDHMPGMNMPSPPSTTNGMDMDHHDHSNDHTMNTMMHMTFFWGKNTQILFSGWPGTRTGMYILALVFVFVLSVVVEWLSDSRSIIGKEKCGGPGSISGHLIRTVVHGLRMGLGYLVMLALMSFNVGVFIVAVGGHAFGYFLFGSGVFGKSTGKDLAPLSC